MTDFTYYDLLGVERDASVAEIRAAWIKCVRWSHSDAGGSDAQTAMFNVAYETLKDPTRRSAYDRDLQNATKTRNRAGESEPRPEPTPPPRADWGGNDEAWVDDDTHDQPRPSPRPGSRPTWWSSRLTQTPIAVTPDFAGRPVELLLAATGFVIVLVIYVLLLGAAGSYFEIALLLTAIVPVLPPTWRRRLPLRKTLLVLGYLTAALLLSSFLAALTTPWAGGVTNVGLLLLLAAGVFTAWLAHRWDRLHQLDAIVGPTQALEHDLYGRPGHRLFDRGDGFPYTHDDLPQRLTAQAVEAVLQIPGAKLIHGLTWPGEPAGLVDHAIICGNRVVLIDSRLVTPGTYRFDSYGALLRDGQPFRGNAVYLAQAVGAWAQLMPAGTEVTGHVVLHSTSGSIRTQDATLAAGSLQLTAGPQAADRIGSHLLPAAGDVDRWTLARLLTLPDHPIWTRGPLSRLITKR